MELTNNAILNRLSVTPESVQTTGGTVDSIPDTSAPDPSNVNSAGEQFSNFLRAALGGAGKTSVNEEELFAGLLQQRIQDVDTEAASFFAAEKSRLMGSMRREDGYVSVEDVAVAALNSTVDAGKIDAATGERINAEAFQAAQLDDNLTALYDSDGSPGDATIAVSDMESALLGARLMIEQIDEGSLTVDSRDLDTPSNSIGGGHGSVSSGSQQAVDGAQGFLWKPVSEGDGNLVVLLPTTLRGLVDSVGIHSAIPATLDNLIEEGRFTTDSHNGNRPHFRFNQPGSSFGENVHVVATMTDGTTQSWEIGSGADRHD